MQDRPDLIESELSGLAFDSNQQIFKTAHIDIMFNQKPPLPVLNEAIYIFIDPAAGGPQSDYAVLSVTRQKGLLTVRLLVSQRVWEIACINPFGPTPHSAPGIQLHK